MIGLGACRTAGPKPVADARSSGAARRAGPARRRRGRHHPPRSAGGQRSDRLLQCGAERPGMRPDEVPGPVLPPERLRLLGRLLAWLREQGPGPGPERPAWQRGTAGQPVRLLRLPPARLLRLERLLLPPELRLP